MLPPSLTPQLLRRLELLRIRSRRTFLGSKQGGHISLKRGHGIEFSDYRQYELGDNPRHIDWGVYARSERLYVKRFREEQDLSVLILVDGSASMFVPADDRKWQFARDLALSLSYVALMQQDTVHVSVLGAHHGPKYYGARAIHTLSNSLMNIHEPIDHDPEKELLKALSRIRFPGVAIFISDFLYDLDICERQFDMMRAKNLDITAIQVLGPRDINPLEGQNLSKIIDSETKEEFDVDFNDGAQREYAARLTRHNDMLKEYFGSAWISFASARSDMPLAQFIGEVLPGTALMQ